MTTDGMLHAKFPRGSLLRDFMYSSAEPILVCRVVSPRVLYRTVVSDSDGRKWKVKVAISHAHIVVAGDPRPTSPAT